MYVSTIVNSIPLKRYQEDISITYIIFCGIFCKQMNAVICITQLSYNKISVL